MGRRGRSADAPEQQVLHQGLLHVHSILVPARGWRRFTSLRDVSLRRNRMHVNWVHPIRPSNKYSIRAFCTCILFWLRHGADAPSHRCAM